MTYARADWLERLALRLLPRPVQDPHGYEPALQPEARLSRGAAVKLALVGAASISFGLWKSAPVRAQTFEDCLKGHDEGLAERIKACDLAVRPRQFFKSYPNSWGLYRGFLYGGERDIILAGTVLGELCILKAKYRMELLKRECYEEVEKTCRQRSVQSASGRSVATCEVPLPPKAPPVTIPPIPSHAPSEACAACSQNGDMCCGSCPNNPLAAPCVGVFEGVPVVDCATALATQC